MLLSKCRLSMGSGMGLRFGLRIAGLALLSYFGRSLSARVRTLNCYPYDSSARNLLCLHWIPHTLATSDIAEVGRYHLRGMGDL